MIVRLASTLTAALAVSVVGPVMLVSSAMAPLAAVGDLLAPAAHGATPVAAGLPACTYEDGSGQRACVWDARHAGNGISHSVVIYYGGTNRASVWPVSHKRAHALIVAWNAR